MVSLNKSRGFTLIEMLVTVALMAVMAVVCWRGLDWVAAQRDAAEREGAELASLVRTFAQLERDLAERLPDAALPARGAAELPLAIGVSLTQEGVTELEILRFLPQAGGQPRALRVLYRIGPEGLVRSTSAVENTSNLSNSEVLLFPGAAALEVRAHAGGFWIQPGRPGGVQPPARAAAIEIAVGDAAGARYVKVLIL